jgi:uncharacterized protein (TIGR02246 family)
MAISGTSDSYDQELTELISRYEGAFNANDAKGMNELFMDDVVFVNFGGNIVFGKEALYQAQKYVFSSGGPLEHIRVSYSIESIRFLKDDIAAVHARQRSLDFSSAHSGSEKDPMQAVFMVIAERHAGRWLIRVGQNTPVT